MKCSPALAVTITSRIPEASTISKDFRDGKRNERVAVSVDMLSTGYNCRDLLNVVLMRPDLLTHRIHPDQRTRYAALHLPHWAYEYEKKFFFLLDFCGVAEYFEEKYDYRVPLNFPRKGKRRTRERRRGTRVKARVAKRDSTTQAGRDG